MHATSELTSPQKASRDVTLHSTVQCFERPGLAVGPADYTQVNPRLQEDCQHMLRTLLYSGQGSGV